MDTAFSLQSVLCSFAWSQTAPQTQACSAIATHWRKLVRLTLQIAQPKTYGERQQVALTCSAGLNLTIPLLVDDINDTVASAFSAFPDRLYIIGKDGKVAYQGGRGPREFSVPEMTAALEKFIEETH